MLARLPHGVVPDVDVLSSPTLRKRLESHGLVPLVTRFTAAAPRRAGAAPGGGSSRRGRTWWYGDRRQRRLARRSRSRRTGCRRRRRSRSRVPTRRSGGVSSLSRWTTPRRVSWRVLDLLDEPPAVGELLAENGEEPPDPRLQPEGRLDPRSRAIVRCWTRVDRARRRPAPGGSRRAAVELPLHAPLGLGADAVRLAAVSAPTGRDRRPRARSKPSSTAPAASRSRRPSASAIARPVRGARARRPRRPRAPARPSPHQQCPARMAAAPVAGVA